MRPRRYPRVHMETEPTYEEISRRAYLYYLRRANGSTGSAEDDWYRARNDLIKERSLESATKDYRVEK